MSDRSDRGGGGIQTTRKKRPVKMDLDSEPQGSRLPQPLDWRRPRLSDNPRWLNILAGLASIAALIASSELGITQRVLLAGLIGGILAGAHATLMEIRVVMRRTQEYPLLYAYAVEAANEAELERALFRSLRGFTEEANPEFHVENGVAIDGNVYLVLDASAASVFHDGDGIVVRNSLSQLFLGVFRITGSPDGRVWAAAVHVREQEWWDRVCKEARAQQRLNTNAVAIAIPSRRAGRSA